MRPVTALLAALLLVAGSTPAFAAGTPSAGSFPSASGAVDPPVSRDADLADPPSDRLGWERGYWHNESLGVDTADGWNGSELDAVLARTMARVEEIRRLEFVDEVSVETRSRDAFREGGNRTISPSLRTFDNAKFEALFLVNESTDSIALQRENAGSSVLGYYDPDRDAIVLVAGGGGKRTVDEVTLGHELVHALQDQHFGLARFDARTRDGRNAQDGLIEGDAGLVEHLYRQRCGAEWACLSTGSETGSGVTNLGVYLVTFFPYSDGPVFVRHFRELGGWTRVNALYDDPPVSSEQVIHPGRYPSDTPTELGTIDFPIGFRTPSPSPTSSTSDTRPEVTPPTPPTPTVTPSPKSSTPGSSTPPENTTTSVARTATPTPTSANGTTPTNPTPANGTATANGTTRTNRTTHTGTPTPTATPPATPVRTHPPTVSTTGTSATDSLGTATSVPPTGTNATGTSLPTPPETVDVPTPSGMSRPTPGPAARWHRVRPPGRPDYATLGEAAIATMFFYPTYHSDGRTGIVPGDRFVNREDGNPARFDPFDYSQRYSEGWDGDRLQVYRNEVNQTAYVWRIAWDSPAEAREFARGYRRLLAYWGGERVAGNVYQLSGTGFADAFHVEISGDRVTVVNAPTVGLLSSLSRLDSIEPRAEGQLTVGDSVGSRVTTRQPGFGPVVALVGIACALLLWTRRTG